MRRRGGRRRERALGGACRAGERVETYQGLKLDQGGPIAIGCGPGGETDPRVMLQSWQSYRVARRV
jgi:hypothetical protein